jgi:hypothetical protein
MASGQQARIKKIRSRVQDERRAVRDLQRKLTAPSAKHLLKPASHTLDDVEKFFLAPKILSEPRAPAQLAHWLDYTEQALETAVAQRKFYEGIVKKYGPTVTLIG